MLCEKVFLEILQNSQENTREFCEISKNTFFYRTALVEYVFFYLMFLNIIEKNWRSQNLPEK